MKTVILIQSILIIVLLINVIRIRKSMQRLINAIPLVIGKQIGIVATRVDLLVNRIDSITKPIKDTQKG